MEEQVKPVLKKPPGYRDPNTTQPQLKPLKNPALPPSFYHNNKSRKRNRSCCRICCCFFCLFFLILFILLTVAGALFYVWFTPKVPVFQFRSVTIDRFNVTLGPDDSVLDSKITLGVGIKNPNEKLAMDYGGTKVSLTADSDTSLGNARLGGFAQPANNVTYLKFGMKVDDQVIDDTSGKKLGSRMRSKAVKMNVAVETKVGYAVGKLKLGKIPVDVKCDATLKQINNGDSPKCSIKVFKWISIDRR